MHLHPSPIDYEACVQRAIDLFMQGYGCSQSVVAAFSDLYQLDRQTVLRLSAGFGAGVGRMRMMCGAVSGLVMLAGMEKGQVRGDDREGKADCYRLVQQLTAAFRERNGSIVCAELLRMGGCTPSQDTPVPDERTAEYYQRRPCVRKVESAARTFAAYLQGQLDTPQP